MRRGASVCQERAFSAVPRGARIAERSPHSASTGPSIRSRRSFPVSVAVAAREAVSFCASRSRIRRGTATSSRLSRATKKSAATSSARRTSARQGGDDDEEHRHARRTRWPSPCTDAPGSARSAAPRRPAASGQRSGVGLDRGEQAAVQDRRQRRARCRRRATGPPAVARTACERSRARRRRRARARAARETRPPGRRRATRSRATCSALASTWSAFRPAALPIET